MAPNPLHDPLSLKRTSMQAELDDSFLPTKRRRYHHKHSIRWRQAIEPPARHCEDEAIIHHQVLRSIALALEAVGFDHGDPLAMESFGAMVEECTFILHPENHYPG